MSQVLLAAAGKAFQKLITPSSSYDCPRCEVLYDTLGACITPAMLEILANDPFVVIAKWKPDNPPARITYHDVTIRDYSGSRFIDRYCHYQVKQLRTFLKRLVDDIETAGQIQPMI